MKKYLFALSIAAAAAAAPAGATVQLSSVAGNATYQGPGFAATQIFDFNGESEARWDQNIFTASANGVRARPLGSTGGFISVGPSDGSPGTFSLTGLGPLNAVSFLWGSIDTYNTLQVLDQGGGVLASFTGSQVWSPANGNQTMTATNRLVRLDFGGATKNSVGGLRFLSTNNAFEVDNIAVAAVPEPATWAMMIGGFGLIGAAARRRARTTIAYA
jgi:hypothetical protein